MTGLLLVTASGLAREVLDVERRTGRYDECLVLDDDPSRAGQEIGGAAIVGPVEMALDFDRHDVVVCAGAGQSRRRLVERLALCGVTADRFARVVAPDVVIPGSCSIGGGCVVLPGVVLTSEVQLGRHVVVMPNVTLTHEDVVEDFATLCAGASVGGRVQIGQAAYIGMNAAIREDVVVGSGATLGMGAALVRDLPPGEVWAGVPAGRIAPRGRMVS